MLTAKEFLEETYNTFLIQEKLKKYYLYTMTKGFDTSFILDLNKIKVKLLDIGKVHKELLCFVNYVVTQQDKSDLNGVYYDYVRLVKPRQFLKTEMWSFFYSLEILQRKFTEISILLKMLSSNSFHEALTFFIFCRNIILKTTNKYKDDFLDDINLTFYELNLILQQIFGKKTAKKIHLIQNISQESKASILMFKIIKDWINHKKTIKKKKKIIKSKSIQNINQIKQNKRPKHKRSSSNNVKVGMDKKKKRKLDLKKTMENIRKEKYYLIKVQEESGVKINRLDGIQSDLDKEYNKLLNRGKKIYEAFFEIYYNLKLTTSKKFIKFPLKEKEVEHIKKFSDFKKINKNRKKEVIENQMYKIVECDLKYDGNEKNQ